mgnify:CR=1 FL=1
MKKYKITYHLINGEIKTVVYENSKNLNKDEFLTEVFKYSNNSFYWYSNEEMTNVMNINWVCFIDIEEIEKDMNNSEQLELN